MKSLQHLESNSLLLALGRRDMIPRSFNRRVIGGGKDAADWRQLPMPRRHQRAKVYDRPVGQGWRASRGRIQGLARPGSGLREGGRRDEVRVRVRAVNLNGRTDAAAATAARGQPAGSRAMRVTAIEPV